MVEKMKKQLHDLLCLLMGEESKWHLMGEDAVDPEFFPQEKSLEKERLVLEAIQTCDATDTPPTVANVKLYTRGRVPDEFIDTIASRKVEASVRPLAYWVLCDIKEYYLQKATEKANRIAAAEFNSVEEKQTLLVDTYLGALPFSSGGGKFTRLQLIDHLKEIQADRVDRRKKNQALGPMFPWRALREQAPILKDGDMTLIVSPTGYGKTMFGMEFARYNAERGIDVLMLLTETSPDVIEQRWQVQHLMVPMKYFDEGLLDLREPKWAEKIKAYEDKQHEIWSQQGRVHIEYIAGETLPQINSKIFVHKQAAKQRKRKLLVIVDYLQDVADMVPGDARVAIEKAIRGLKVFCVNHSVHMVVFSQQTLTTNDGGEARSHGSMTPKMKAQHMLIIERRPAQNSILREDGNGNPLKDSLGQNRFWQVNDVVSLQSIVRLKLIKSSNGPTGYCFVAVETPVFRIVDISLKDPRKLPHFMQVQIQRFIEEDAVKG